MSSRGLENPDVGTSPGTSDHRLLTQSTALDHIRSPKCLTFDLILSKELLMTLTRMTVIKERREAWAIMLSPEAYEDNTHALSL
jgi:hypothetical protein